MVIHIEDEQEVPLSRGRLRRLAELVLEREGLPDDAEAGVRFVSDRAMARLNSRFLGREGPTDVLSLPIENLRPGGGWPDTGGAPLNLGDAFVAPSYVHRRAARRGDDPESEMGLMVVHGLLHLLGYDHQLPEEAERMESRERELLAGAGFAPGPPASGPGPERDGAGIIGGRS